MDHELLILDFWVGFGYAEGKGEFFPLTTNYQILSTVLK
jgi:hypothetical protein